jgi:hypothetical protein
MVRRNLTSTVKNSSEKTKHLSSLGLRDKTRAGGGRDSNKKLSNYRNSLSLSLSPREKDVKKCHIYKVISGLVRW